MSDNQIPGLPEDNMSFNFRKTPVSKEAQENNWRKVKEAISTQVPVRNINWYKRLTAAASVALLISAGAWYAVNYFSNNAEQSSNLYKTEFAKTKKIILPDGSKVTLNANSELKLSAAWNEENERQVWLEGEAYFEVEKKLATNQKFIVHTKDLDVEVLGTKFNVNTRHKKALVSLEEGKIKLSLKEDPTASTKQKFIKNVIEMKPGEVVKIDTGFSLQAEKNISFHSGWIRNEFHFNNTSLKDISTLIFDTYGYTVVVEDQELLKRTISGDLRANNLNELIEVLQVAFKLKMTITNKTVNIGRF
jgi:transmembrane sensor